MVDGIGTDGSGNPDSVQLNRACRIVVNCEPGIPVKTAIQT
jgi:hypothetical protein